MQQNTPAWPPDYNLRRSPRARRVSLRVLPPDQAQGGAARLEVILPPGTDEAEAACAVEKHKAWVLRHLYAAVAEPGPNSGFTTLSPYLFLHGGILRVRLEWAHQHIAPLLPGPEEIDRILREARLEWPHPEKELGCAKGAARANAVGETAEGEAAVEAVKLTESLEKRPEKRPEARPEALAETLPQTQPEICPGARLNRVCRLKEGGPARRGANLRLWLGSYAKAFLSARLAALAASSNLPYQGLRLGWQRGRWGSYSCRGTVSLNAMLVFLPPALSDFVILHELCHSQAMNHGPAFKKLLCALEPHYRSLDASLKQARIFLPPNF